MSLALQPRRQRPADQAAPTGDEHRALRRWATAARRALCSGSVASVCSTALVTWLSHRRTDAPPVGTNATSQWLWGKRAHRRDGWSLRHTLVGYAIHHASSLFWASAFEHWRRGRRAPASIVALAAAITALAYVVDYHVVPPRLSPGFDQRLRRGDLFVVYAAFGAGLALPWLLRHMRRRRVNPAPPASAPAGRRQGR